MLFRVLGPVQVDTGDGVRVPSGARARALLTALLTQPGEVVPVHRLAEALWGEDLPAHPGNAVQVVVGRLRRSLGPAGALIVTRPQGYVVELRGARLDADLFEEECRAARALVGTDPSAAVALLDRALHRWRGPAYGELGDSFAEPAAVRLAELRRAAAVDRAEALLRAGAVDEAVAAARDLTAADPLADRPLAVLMSALAAAGRTTDALEAFRRHADELRQELGLDPPTGLRELHERILRADVTPPPSPHPARAACVSLPRRLTPLTPLVGRVEERAALAGLLAEHRLVTAVGPGGVGKTRLALAVAGDVAGRFRDGVVVVDLVPVTDDAAVPAAVAAALGAGDEPGRSATQAVEGRLATRQVLLVLDNCEHLLDGAGALVERLLAAAPGLSVLTTSRARLLLPAERAFPVSGLAPADAVRLFVERAAASGVEVPPDARAERICRRLDGVALAIELAAARMPAIGLDGVERGLQDQLEVLAGSRRADARHRSLRSALDWSHALLGPHAQAVLRRLSVFAGPVDAASAAGVVAWPPVARRAVGAELARLADHSLVVPVRGSGATRYRVLETVRQYGASCSPTATSSTPAGSRTCAGAGTAHASCWPGPRSRGDRGSTTSPMSCAPPSRGHRSAPTPGRTCTRWPWTWPRCATGVVSRRRRSDGTSRLRRSRRDPRPRTRRCVGRPARPRPVSPATTPSTCTRPRRGPRSTPGCRAGRPRNSPASPSWPTALRAC